MIQEMTMESTEYTDREIASLEERLTEKFDNELKYGKLSEDLFSISERIKTLEMLAQNKQPINTGFLNTGHNLIGKTFFSCVACMSVLADALSWANYNKEKVVTTPELADNIVVLSCQVTDLAILNDLRTAENYQMHYPDKKLFIGGCLARRFDIPLPTWAYRLDHIRRDYQPLYDRSLVHYEKPFWVKNFEPKGAMDEGNLFRDCYPLRIGVGCKGKCTYCTINHTRGTFYELGPNEQIREFTNNNNRNVVLIADSPSAPLVREWCEIAKKHNKPVNIRNLEPQEALKVFESLEELSILGLLPVLHVPIQSMNKGTLKTMGRRVKETLEFVYKVPTLKDHGTKVATNVIIYDQNMDDYFNAKKIFDYVSWNPYWDGKWDRAIAEYRFDCFIR